MYTRRSYRIITETKKKKKLYSSCEEKIRMVVQKQLDVIYFLLQIKNNNLINYIIMFRQALERKP